jgi:hypothetical protein
MGVSLDGKLVVAISSRALFDFEEENQIFEQGDDRAYMQLQLQRLEQPAKPGVAFSLVRKLLAFNDADAQRVEVVILSRNDPVSGLRVFRSAQHYGLPIERGSFTRGQPPWRYLKPLACQPVSVSAPERRARRADAGVPAAQVYPHSVHASDAHTPTKCALRLTAMPCCFQRRGRTRVPGARAGRLPAARARQGHQLRCPTVRSSRCWWPCTGCSRQARPPCASAPRWSPPAAPRPMSAPSAR